jgi:prepilin-type N-terminal cleavage/methylation domain-containing protein
MKTRSTSGKAAGRRQNAEGDSISLRAAGGFTLVEMLVVIGVILALAAMTFPILNAVKKAQAISRAKAELSHIETAIEAYKTKLGFYPPDNPLSSPDWTINQLYFELMGTRTTIKNNVINYQTLDGSALIATSAFGTAFKAGTKVTGFLNCSQAGASEDAPPATKFLAGLKPAQFLEVNSPVSSTVLGVSMSGSPVFNGPTGEIVPYGYNSSSPQHNTSSFDLWVDVLAAGQTNRICNWSKRPILVYYTSMANSYP